jgi:NADPH-dependent 2,4-dienoyl-CoA reductase/sulfur reductase-like enzyme
MAERLVVIGGVAAGMSAAARGKRKKRAMDVIVYQQDAFVSYAACGMPYLVSGEIADYRSLIVRTPQQMAEQGVQVHVRHKVTGIDTKAQRVTVQELDGAREFTQGYDNLVIATGARPVQPPLPGAHLEGVFALRSLESGIKLLSYAKEHQPRRAVVIGGGYIGIEMAEAFRHLGLDVKMLVRSGKLMRATLDDDIRKLVEGELAQQGVDVLKDSPVAFEGNHSLQAVVTEGSRYPCDLALVGIGARPNVELGHAAGIALGATGAIATDAHMRTNVPGVFAAGDCAEALHLVTGKPAYIPLGSTANKQGRIAGTNAAGGNATFGGVVGTMVVRAFSLAVSRTGLTSAQARASGYTPRETIIHAKDISHYFPGAEDVHVKLVTAEDTGRLLGGQIVGQLGVAKRIDVLATALHHRLTVPELQRLDLGYAPPFAPVWDPILVAANVAAR